MERYFGMKGFTGKVSELANDHGNSGILHFDLMEEKFSTILFTADNDISRNFRVTSLKGELKIVEHYRSRFLKIWKVIGNKVEGFSLVLQYTYVFCVLPSRMLQYDVISEIDEETYLMQVNAWNRGINKNKLEIFYPRTIPTKLKSLFSS
ncbi:hypothetical protein M5689_011732 [Euphorbia peplus]|nr:hypothetical protein M5689_011732 [Euphorbia peplus]